MPVGRPTKLTKKIQARVCKGLKNGLTRELAFRCAGIADRTGFLWLEKGREGKTPYAQFLQAVHRATAESEEQLLRTVVTAAVKDKDWRAALKLLQVRWPERYYPKRLLEVSGPAGGPIPMESHDALAKIIANPEAADLLSRALEKANNGDVPELPWRGKGRRRAKGATGDA